jgi:hypothetical protein
MGTLLTIITGCVVLCTIAYVFGKDNAKKTLFLPFKIIFIVAVIFLIFYIGYQIFIFGSEVFGKLPWNFWILAILVLAHYLSNLDKNKKI